MISSPTRIASPPSFSTLSPTVSSAPTQPKENSDTGRLTNGETAGILIAVFAFLAGVIALWWLLRKSQRAVYLPPPPRPIIYPEGIDSVAMFGRAHGGGGSCRWSPGFPYFPFNTLVAQRVV